MSFIEFNSLIIPNSYSLNLNLLEMKIWPLKSERGKDGNTCTGGCVSAEDVLCC